MSSADRSPLTRSDLDRALARAASGDTALDELLADAAAPADGSVARCGELAALTAFRAAAAPVAPSPAPSEPRLVRLASWISVKAAAVGGAVVVATAGIALASGAELHLPGRSAAPAQPAPRTPEPAGAGTGSPGVGGEPAGVRPESSADSESSAEREAAHPAREETPSPATRPEPGPAAPGADPRPGVEGSGHRPDGPRLPGIDRPAGEPSDSRPGSHADGPRTDGPRGDGPRGDGSRDGGPRGDGPGDDGSREGGPRGEGPRGGEPDGSGSGTDRPGSPGDRPGVADRRSPKPPPSADHQGRVPAPPQPASTPVEG